MVRTCGSSIDELALFSLAFYRWEKRGLGKWEQPSMYSYSPDLAAIPHPCSASPAVERDCEWKSLFGMHVCLFLTSSYTEKWNQLSRDLKAMSWPSSAFILLHFDLLDIGCWLPLSPVVWSWLIYQSFSVSDIQGPQKVYHAGHQGLVPLKCFLQLRWLCAVAYGFLTLW